MSIRIAIVEDDVHYNNALKKVIDYQRDMETVVQFFHGNDVIEGLVRYQPDIVIMDIQLPSRSGVEIVKLLKKEMPYTHFIMCTNFEDDEKVFGSLKAGASGYLIKGESMEKILNSIREVYNGGAPMSYAIAKKVLRYFQNTTKEKKLEMLTNKENEILIELSKGLQYKEIADKHCISLDTVKKHISNIYKKLEVSNKTEAINKLNQ